MADNLLYTNPLRHQLDYTSNFKNLLLDNDNEKKLLSRLKEARDKLHTNEAIFYDFYGASSYEDFQDKIADCLHQDPQFYQDFYTVTNTNINSNTALKSLISQTAPDRKTYFELSEKDQEKLLNDVVNQLLLVDQDGKLTFAAESFFFKQVKFKTKPKGKGRTLSSQAIAELDKAQLDFAKNISENIKDEITTVIKTEFLEKGLLKFTSQDIKASGEKNISRMVLEKIVNIYQEALQKAEPTILTLSLKEGGEYNFTFSPTDYDVNMKNGSLPVIRMNEAIEVSRTLFTDLQSTGQNYSNPVMAQKAQYIGEQKDWVKNLKTPEVDKLNGNINGPGNINTVYGWLYTKIGLRSDTFKEYFQQKINSPDLNQKKYFIREMVNPSKFIGMLGEDFSELLFSKLTGGKATATVTGIGGRGKSAAELAVVDKFRGGKQPPVDTLIKFYNEMLGMEMFHTGIQVKHSYQSDAQTSHKVGFLPEKSIEGLFKQDLAELFFKNANQNIDGTVTSIERTNSFVDDFIPLLQGYFGNITIQYLLKKKFQLSSESFTLEEQEALKQDNIISAIDIINRIFSYFIDLSMDLGVYSNVAGAMKERNLFVFYLNEYFIPSSAIIDWAIKSIENSDNYIFSVQPVYPTMPKKKEGQDALNKIVDSEGILSLIENQPETISVENASKNLLSKIKISGATKFTKGNIGSFNLLAKYFEKYKT